jgi:HD-GYP domain-containing protein (c-di-GMP phosphodiesterase class II)
LEIGAELGLSEEQLNTLELAVYVHDLGKIGIPDEVLSKPGKLTDDEWVDILRHPSLSAGFLAGIEELAEVASIVRHHHERVDGSGYPDGFKGEAIPFLSRILSVADAFEAMTSPRPYRKAISWEEALAELRNNAGTQFDPEVVEAAARVVERAIGMDKHRKKAA